MNSDLGEELCLPISKINLERDLQVLCHDVSSVLRGDTYVSSMKMGFDDTFMGWYFLEGERNYYILDIVRPN